ncbi:unnamed protein product [Cylicostephanus goldi]|uniref:Uncharacterized protein n=1 Tax=Cylicostephanus goldi TaxID=71465 RepID=A0A3P6RYL6_CYLGO|nr:unnamed protein product [Cylicostephanus goldi]
MMRRIHTFQSEEGEGAHEDSFEDLDFPSEHYDDDDNEPTPSQQPVDRKLLFVPDIHELKLDQGEKPPHKRVCTAFVFFETGNFSIFVSLNLAIQDVIEKIPMRVRSQSWLIRTRHLLHEERVSFTVLIYLL